MRGVFILLLILLTVGGMHRVGLASDAPAKEGLHLLALPEFREMTEQFPPEIRFEVAAVVNIHMHQYAQAIPLLEVLVSEQPNRSELWILLALAYNRDDAPQDAYDAANIAITLEPYHDAYYIERGVAAYLLGQDRQAAQDLTRFLKAFDRVPRAYYYMGLVAARQGNLGLARRALNNAWALEPNLRVPVLYQLASLDVATGRLDRAKSSLALVSEVFEGFGTQTERMLARQVQVLGDASEVVQAVQLSDASHAAKDTPQPLSASR